MFEHWLKFWRQWMFWWLAGVEKPEKDKPAQAQDPNQKTTSTPSETEAADVDAAATWRPAPGEPAVAKPRADDLAVIRGIGPAIACKLNLNPAVGGAGDRLRGAVSLRDERFAGGFGRSPIGRSPDG
jgi:hypothetical protein